MKKFKQFKYKILSVVLVVAMVLPVFFTPMTAMATDSSGNDYAAKTYSFPLYVESSSYPLGNVEEDFQYWFVRNQTSYKYFAGFYWGHPSLDFVCFKCESTNEIWFVYCEGNFTFQNAPQTHYTDDTSLSLIASSNMVYTVVDATTGAHLRTGLGIFKMGIYLPEDVFYYSTDDIYSSSSDIFVFLENSEVPAVPGTDYDHNYSPKNEFIDNGYEFGSTLENIQTETLVTADEEPNVFLRIFKNISIMVSNAGIYVQALYEEFVHAIDYFFNEIVPEVFYKTMSEINKTIYDILDFFNGFYENIKDVLLAVFLTIWNHEIIAGISLHSIWEFFRDILIEMRDALQQLASGESSLGDLVISALPDHLEQIFAVIWNSGAVDGEFNLLAFFEFWLIPEEDFLESTFYELKENRTGLLRVIEIKDEIELGLVSVEPVAPVISISGGTYGILTIKDIELNFYWFEAWKPYTDPIIAAFFYMTYIWHLILQIPGIIHGGAGAVASGGYYAEREIKRQNRERSK